MLNLIFLIIHVLKNNSSGFVSRAWEIVFDAYEIDVCSPQVWHSGVMINFYD